MSRHRDQSPRMQEALKVLAEHGKVIDTDDDTVADGVSLKERLSQLRTVRLRHQFVPLGVIAALHAGGAVAARGVASGAEVGQQVAWVTAVTYLVVGVVAWWVYDRSHPTNRRSRRRYTTAVVLAGLSWLITASILGAGGAIGALLWIGGYIAAWPYWKTHRIHVPDDKSPIPTGGGIVVRELHPVEKLWNQRIATSNILGGSQLINPRRVKAGPQFTIQLRHGAHTSHNAVAATPNIASALERPLDAVVIDAVGSNMSQATLLIVENNPLHKTLAYPSDPTSLYSPTTGMAIVGIHPDEEPAHWSVFVPSWGLAGGAIYGGIGGGKSGFMTNLAIAMRHTGLLSVWAGDPQGGQSLPQLMKHASWPATTLDEIRLQLEAAVKGIKIRSVLNGLRGIDLHVPTPAEPGIVLFIDELHKLAADPELYVLLDIVAREGRKAAIAAIVADQSPILATFGGLDTLRAALQARNTAVFRTATRLAKGMIAGLEIDPYNIRATFPDGSPTTGLGYLVGQRTAPFRGWRPHEQAGQLLTTAKDPVLDDTVANFIGDTYLRRDQRRLEARAQAAATIQRYDPRALDHILANEPELAAALNNLKYAPAAIDLKPVAGTPSRTTATGTVLRLAPAPRFEAPKRVVPQILTTPAGSTILQLLTDGMSAPKDLQAHTNLSETRVRDVLNALAQSGLARRVRHGTWSPTDAGARAVKEHTNAG